MSEREITITGYFIDELDENGNKTGNLRLIERVELLEECVFEVYSGADSFTREEAIKLTGVFNSHGKPSLIQEAQNKAR